MENFITNIKVSIAYEDINKPNLSEYEYHPEWLMNLQSNQRKFLQWLHLDYLLGNQFHTFNKNTLSHRSEEHTSELQSH